MIDRVLLEYLKFYAIMIVITIVLYYLIKRLAKMEA